MSDYAIGDIQGCFNQLLQLLDAINFHEHTDRLWFVGDLVNRGPQSLNVLRLIQNLPITPRMTLGNHDFHLLSLLFSDNPQYNRDDTLEEILAAPDAESIGHWLRHQSVLYHDPELNIVMCHAGINPVWNLEQAQYYAQKLESALKGPDYQYFLTNMYGNHPDHWSVNLTGIDLLRVICNYFTRMRFCDVQGHLVMHHKGPIAPHHTDLYPWYATPNRQDISADIVFGHWAALRGQCPHPRIHAIDTGCIWGGELTALRLQDKRRFSVSTKRL